LRSLNLYGVPLDDATAGLFRKCTGVTELFIGGTQLSDTGLAALVGPQLATAELHHTRVTDAGLGRLRAARLKELRLDGTNVTDAGVTALKAQTGLKVLKIKRTGITSAGVKELASALPKCTIEWDGGTIKP
jgi:hypothetical protein